MSCTRKKLSSACSHLCESVRMKGIQFDFIILLTTLQLSEFLQSCGKWRHFSFCVHTYVKVDVKTKIKEKKHWSCFVIEHKLICIARSYVPSFFFYKFSLSSTIFCFGVPKLILRLFLFFSKWNFINVSMPMSNKERY